MLESDPMSDATLGLAPTMIESINAAIAPLVLERQIGRGGIASVFLAHLPNQEGPSVAIKVLLEESQDLVEIQRFRLEFDLLQSVQHSGVVSVHRFFQEPVPAFTMEYLEGPNLRDFFKLKQKQDPLPPSRLPFLINCCRQILEILHHIHQKHIVHRDLKPENFILVDQAYIKLIDFGVARHQKMNLELTQKQEIIGTFEYIAPEVLMGNVYDHRVDLYSLGVMLYRFLSGRRFFDVYSFVDLFRAKSTKESPQLDPETYGTFGWFAELVNRLISKNPEGRFSSAAEALGVIGQFHSEGIRTPKVSEVLDGVLPSPLLVIRGLPLVGRDDEKEQMLKWLDSSGRDILVVRSYSGLGKTRSLNFVHHAAMGKGFEGIQLDCRIIPAGVDLFDFIFERLAKQFFPEKDNVLAFRDVDSQWVWNQSVFASMLFDQVSFNHLSIVMDNLHLLTSDQVDQVLLFFQQTATAHKQGTIFWSFSVAQEEMGKLITRDGHSLFDFLPRYRLVTLQPLSENGILELSTLLLGHHAPDPGLLQEIVDYSNGLPYSVANVIATLQEKGWLYRGVKSWGLSPQAMEKGSEKLGRQLFDERLEKLSSLAKKILKLIVTMGQKVRLSVLQRGLSLSGERIDAAINELIIAQILSSDGPLLILNDSTIQSVFYERQSEQEKVEHHELALRLLEPAYREQGSEFSGLELLRHANLAGNREKAAWYSAAIGPFFFKKGMYEEAQQYFGNALAQGSDQNALFRIETFFWKAESELALNRLREAWGDYQNGETLLDQLLEEPETKRHRSLKKIKQLALHKKRLIDVFRQRWESVVKLEEQLRTYPVEAPEVSSSIRIVVPETLCFTSPFTTGGQRSHHLARMVFQGLLRLQEDGGYAGDLAKHWYWDEHAQALTFELNRSRSYHNGALVRAEDVKFSLEMVQTRMYFHPALTLQSGVIDACVVKNAQTIAVFYRKGCHPIMKFWADLPIVPAYLYGHEMNPLAISPQRGVIGSGPLMVTRQDEHGWLLKSQDPATCPLELVVDREEEFAQLKLKGAHLIQLSYDKWLQLTPSLQAQMGLVRGQQLVGETFRLCFKPRQHPYLTPYVRQMLLKALPLEMWCHLYLKQAYVPIRNGLVNHQVAEGVAKISRQAKMNFANAMMESGAFLRQGSWHYKNKPIEVNLLAPVTPSLQKFFRALASFLSELGLKTHLAKREMHEFGQYLGHDKVNAWLDWIPLTATLDGLDGFLHSDQSSHGANVVGYQNREMDELLSLLSKTPISRRKGVQNRVTALFLSELPWIPLIQPLLHYAYDVKLLGLRPRQTGFCNSPDQLQRLELRS
jgi:serine/threonine protein kinase/tetratricopeptide (TPR) repeat protein